MVYVLAIAAVVLLAAVVVPLARLFLRQDRLIFRPGPVLDRTPASIGLRYEELVLPAPDGGGVPAWWIAAGPDAPAVVYFHGSDGNITRELNAVQFLHALGVNVLLVEYDGYGGDGRRPNESGCYRTVDAAWDHLLGVRGFPEDRVILFGHSLGAAVAARGAAGRSCGGLVLESGFTSVPDLAARAYPYLPVRPFLRTRLNALESVRHSRCAVLVIHSQDDEHIPYDLGRRLYEEARTTKKLVTLRGSHFSRAWQRSAESTAAWRELLTHDFVTWAAPPEPT
jgi:pimeloyl-ACP methyl ester carboxylesterase